jgi:signal transduction histidine kinase
VSQPAAGIADVRRTTDIIEREVVNVDRLIGDLVDVSRIQLGALELRCKRAPVPEPVSEAPAADRFPA